MPKYYSYKPAEYPNTGFRPTAGFCLQDYLKNHNEQFESHIDTSDDEDSTTITDNNQSLDKFHSDFTKQALLTQENLLFSPKRMLHTWQMAEILNKFKAEQQITEKERLSRSICFSVGLDPTSPAKDILITWRGNKGRARP